MEAQGFIGQEGKLGLARIILKSSREFFKGGLLRTLSVCLEDTISVLGVQEPWRLLI